MDWPQGRRIFAPIPTNRYQPMTLRTLRPTISGSYGHAWGRLRTHFLHLLLVALIVGFFDIPLFSISPNESDGAAGAAVLLLLLTAYAYLIRPIVGYGADLVYLRCMRDEAVDITEVFDGFRRNYLSIVLAYLLTTAIVGFGFVMLIVPGIIFLCRLTFVPYLVMDKKLEPVAAVEKSWSMTRGHTWRIFGMYVTAVVLFLLGLLLLVVGAFFSLIWTRAAFASLYHAIDAKEQDQLDANGEPHPVPA